jgi:hypothetical protein
MPLLQDAPFRDAMHTWLVSQQPPAKAATLVGEWWQAFRCQLPCGAVGGCASSATQMSQSSSANSIAELHRVAKIAEAAQTSAAQHTAAAVER